MEGDIGFVKRDVANLGFRYQGFQGKKIDLNKPTSKVEYVFGRGRMFKAKSLHRNA
jgi:hypothetical protein